MNRILLLAGFLLLAGTNIQAQETIDGDLTGLGVEGPLIVELVQGNSNQITRVENADDVTWEVKDNGSLHVKGVEVGEGEDAPRIKIEMKALENLAISGSVILNAEDGIESEDFNLAVTGQSIVNVKLEVEELNAAVDRQSILNVNGSAEEVNLAVDRQSIANVKEVEMEEMNVSANRQSVVEVGENRDIEMNTHTENQSIINRN